jgi:hypothetical protein
VLVDQGLADRAVFRWGLISGTAFHHIDVEVSSVRGTASVYVALDTASSGVTLASLEQALGGELKRQGV